jgi:hypothetical protein
VHAGSALHRLPSPRPSSAGCEPQAPTSSILHQPPASCLSLLPQPQRQPSSFELSRSGGLVRCLHCWACLADQSHGDAAATRTLDP